MPSYQHVLHHKIYFYFHWDPAKTRTPHNDCQGLGSGFACLHHGLAMLHAVSPNSQPDFYRGVLLSLTAQSHSCFAAPCSTAAHPGAGGS